MVSTLVRILFERMCVTPSVKMLITRCYFNAIVSTLMGTVTVVPSDRDNCLSNDALLSECNIPL